MPAGYASTNTASDPPVTTTGLGIGPDENSYLNSNPDAAFMRYLTDSGYYNPATSFGKYAQGQQGRIYSQYQSVAAADPNMGFYNYLTQNHPDLQGDFMNQSPEARGDFSSRMLTPRARWVMG